ncbi:phage late control D family protein [Paraburkholderia sp. 32]|uniref:phage late control D family protein n=1 Tax=Paraburkholderia sp. 32 TaxID=2991057 RepID=UPI003D1CF04E
MRAFMSLYDESVISTNGNFYAPGFELRIDGVGLPKGVLRDVMEVTYHDDINEIDGFELTVNNWDDSARCCKYIGSETAAQLSGGTKSTQFFTLFDPGGKSAELALGYSGHFQSMVRAGFTTMEPNFPESGPPVLTVRGFNILKGLRSKQFTTSWTNQTPSAIALNFNTLRNGGQPRLPPPWRVVTNDQAAKAESPIDYVAQDNQYDVDFLLQLAHGQGYTLEADEDAQELSFGPSQSSTPTNYLLEWGKGLMSFKPSLATANQWKSVTVRGWDRQTQKPIVVTVSQNDPQVKKLNSGLLSLVPDRQEQKVDLPVFTAAEAKQRALAIMLERSKEIVTAHGKTVGLPKLRAGTLVNIQGIGARLSGTYFVTKTTHTLGESGYVTEFDCRREDLGAAGGSP